MSDQSNDSAVNHFISQAESAIRSADNKKVGGYDMASYFTLRAIYFVMMAAFTVFVKRRPEESTLPPSDQTRGTEKVPGRVSIAMAVTEESGLINAIELAVQLREQGFIVTTTTEPGEIDTDISHADLLMLYGIGREMGAMVETVKRIDPLSPILYIYTQDLPTIEGMTPISVNSTLNEIIRRINHSLR